ncbi:phenazine biosynthesis FMN-dependent oxidase PhzG [Actinoalloteichus spitiensis]|uniref:phenazine biosynthesis FMN-dependent oxidase PhzG n=1 Tax=Actinoalloteichus spitiensis TaxID=252394 RepID=UPI000369DC49|nr:phenazine biosynthesis FMN-dependent oxidase PhzG [Actinoalloteichus spitiensis]
MSETIQAGRDEESRPANTLSGDESLVLPEFDAPPADPFGLLRRWIALAEEYRVREPLAVSLATADAAGRPSNRVVLVKEIVDGGLVFTSHTGSRKGRDLAVQPWASMNFYWRESLQQITLAGPVEALPASRSDELFAERPLAAQATTAVSAQSTPLVAESELHTRARELIEAGTALPRPAGWGGYRLLPREIEFWQGKASRLHRRLSYSWENGGWTYRRLQP